MEKQQVHDQQKELMRVMHLKELLSSANVLNNRGMNLHVMNALKKLRKYPDNFIITL